MFDIFIKINLKFDYEENLTGSGGTILALTQTDLINAILLERRIEFLGEGMRNNNLLRLLQTIPAKGSVPSKSPSAQGYIWPISSDESLNALMTDN